ncbi:Uncharacterised protein [Serratia ficaria]|uniref:phage baseplate plug family protein n=1 Tax=Serratia ficaria TaxID=61651 RepID=UPI0021C4D81A|nr:hypothetical protein [Serratia ficaria]CAI2787775.1 Uncharacterised protein [Serratia ficaria]
MPIQLSFQPGLTTQTMQETFDGYPVTLKLKWNERFGFWSLGIFDRESNPILSGIKLVQNFPLMGDFHLTQFGGELLFLKVNGDKDRPDLESIGGDHILLYIEKDEVSELIS